MLPSSKATEKTRLHCRHIDLRTDRMQRALRIRSDVVHKMRRFLIEYAKFVDVETPTLFRRTPGGSAEFLVPAPPPNRGLCYSLPQSPQQFKQLLMVGGIDRYFQIARCYRDEGSKGDRQPEFTQVDLELSFTTQDGVMSLVEELLIAAWPEELVDLKPCAPFPRLKYCDAMRQYGSDKPDMRIPWHIEDCTELLDFMHGKGATKDWVARLIVCKGQANIMKRSVKKELKRILDNNKNSRPFVVCDGRQESWFDTVSNFVFVERFGVEKDDCVIFSWGDEEGVQWTLGQLRNLVADAAGMRKQRKICAHWIVDFPLFSMEDSQLVSNHHPFTAPIEKHREWLNDEEKFLGITGQHYDLVINGVEIGGGSIRIHDSEEQARVLEILGENTREMDHLLHALSHGAPPHGGFALGLDRYVALLLGQGDPAVPVREVTLES
nr:Aminoacyl-tRNA synthetase domain containing protein [Haemonchus contortus]